MRVDPIILSLYLVPLLSEARRVPSKEKVSEKASRVIGFGAWGCRVQGLTSGVCPKT